MRSGQRDDENPDEWKREQKAQGTEWERYEGYKKGMNARGKGDTTPKKIWKGTNRANRKNDCYCASLESKEDKCHKSKKRP